jgi:hypothetical protein
VESAISKCVSDRQLAHLCQHIRTPHPKYANLIRSRSWPIFVAAVSDKVSHTKRIRSDQGMAYADYNNSAFRLHGYTRRFNGSGLLRAVGLSRWTRVTKQSASSSSPAVESPHLILPRYFRVTECTAMICCVMARFCVINIHPMDTSELLVVPQLPDSCTTSVSTNP